MDEYELRFHFNLKPEKVEKCSRLDAFKEGFRNTKDIKYRFKKDKTGYFKLYQKYEKRGRFRLRSIYFLLEDITVSIHEAGGFKRDWHSFWKGMIVDLYNYFTKMTASNKEEVLKLFSDPYGGVLCFKISFVNGDPAECAMTEDHAKLMDRYNGWCCIEFDTIYWDAYRCEAYRKYLEKRNIFNAYWQYDAGCLWMFFKRITGKELELAVRRFNFLMNNQREVNKRLSNHRRLIFETTKPWNNLPNPVYTKPRRNKNK